MSQNEAHNIIVSLFALSDIVLQAIEAQVMAIEDPL